MFTTYDVEDELSQSINQSCIFCCSHRVPNSETQKLPRSICTARSFKLHFKQIKANTSEVDFLITY